MLLTVLERILLLNVLPPEGDITTIRIMRDLKNELSFTELEHKDLQLTPKEDGSISWDGSKAVDKDITIGPKASGILIKGLEKLSESGKINFQLLDLYDKLGGEIIVDDKTSNVIEGNFGPKDKPVPPTPEIA